VHAFGWYLRQYVSEAKAKGAFPVLLSPTPVNLWEAGSLKRDQGGFGRWAQEVSRIAGVEFIDVNSLISDRYELLGQARVGPLFCSSSDHVHTSPAGAKENAALVVSGLNRIQRLGLSGTLRI
jgi:rhamnogalacturonan acetylesterase